MKRIFTIMVFVLLTSYNFAQSFATDTLSQSKIKKLDFLTGSWEGSGWMMTPAGSKEGFNQTENIQFKLDSTAVLIEGVGKSEGEIIHNALAVIRYNKEDNDYTFHSYLQNGRQGEFTAELIDGKFYWYPNENMRYIIEINDTGLWFEKGEIEQGDNWFQFFEMTLNKSE